MAITIVDANTYVVGTAANPAVFALPVGHQPAAGEAVILTTSLVTKTRTLNSVSDDVSSAWAVLNGAGSSSAGSDWMAWTGAAAGTATQISQAMSGTSKTQASVLIVDGLAGTTDVVPAAVNLTTATNAPSVSVTITDPSDLIVATYGGPASVVSVDAPFTLQAMAGGAGLQNAVATLIPGATGTYTCTFRLASAVACTVAVASFPAAAAPIVIQAPLAVASASALVPGAGMSGQAPPPPVAAATTPAMPQAGMVGVAPVAIAAGQAFGATPQVGPAPASGFTPPWRPYFEGRNGIGFDQD